MEEERGKKDEEVMGNEEAAGNPLPAGKKRGERYESSGEPATR